MNAYLLVEGSWKKCKLTESVLTEHRIKFGDGVNLGNGVNLGDGVNLGNGVNLGDHVKLGDGVNLGDHVKLGDGVTSQQLNESARETYRLMGRKHRFTKWVTADRMSPNFDGGTPIKYLQGATIEVLDAEVSDQQCAPGLHVLRFGHRPEWYGLCRAGHNLIALTVEVESEDILFAGLPTMDGKLRVRKLIVKD